MVKTKLQEILNGIQRARIAVIGDFCLDAYWFLDESMSEISVETGKTTLPVAEQRYSLGGAGNVTNNLAALGAGRVYAFGVIGTDPFGTEMTRLMKDARINTDNLLIQNSNWATHTYCKPYIKDNEQNRVDFGNFNNLLERTADELLKRLSDLIDEIDVLIINQQVPSGIHTPYFRKKLIGLITGFPSKTFITDSRSFNDHFTGTIRKMNENEALRLCGKTSKPDDAVSISEVEEAARKLFEKYAKPLFITRGAKGSVIVNETGIKEMPGLLILSETDTVGAGDSYLAGAASTLAAGYTFEEAAEMGTLVAGVTVQKLFQTGIATPEEILKIGNDPDYIYVPDLAEDTRNRKLYINSEIEIISKTSKNLKIRHAIFDHDGTISTFRQGWEKIMSSMMIKAILGNAYETIEEPVYRRVKFRVDDYIDKTTGIQTIAQMQGLVKLVEEFRFVQKEDIADAKGYKKIFNEELIVMVRERERKFRNGELSLEDLTIKGSVPLLKYLHESGIKLYLASGTDVEDVRNEAKILGYDTFFEGRIFGSVGDIAKDAKKVVLDKILDSIGQSEAQSIITFGDGPVEMRETRKIGGLAVGVASDEIRRFGLNEHKRERLIKAGASLIIPDFSQYKILLKLLNL